MYLSWFQEMLTAGFSYRSHLLSALHVGSLRAKRQSSPLLERMQLFSKSMEGSYASKTQACILRTRDLSSKDSSQRTQKGTKTVRATTYNTKSRTMKIIFGKEQGTARSQVYLQLISSAYWQFTHLTQYSRTPGYILRTETWCPQKRPVCEYLDKHYISEWIDLPIWYAV